MIELPEKVAEFFPYKDVRPFQDEFIRTIHDAIREGRSAIVEGSNELEKTIAVLCACLPLAEEENLKILYVARTHRQHERVIEELRAVSARHRVSGVSVRGRHEMRLNQLVRENAQNSRGVMEICEMLKSKNRCPYTGISKTREGKALKYRNLSPHVLTLHQKSRKSAEAETSVPMNWSRLHLKRQRSSR